MLQVAGIDARHGDVQALWDVSLEVRQGEVVTIIGPNGAGKTTLMRTIMGLHRPSAGTIHLDGAPIHTLPAHRVSARGVILVPEGRRLFGGMRVIENLEVHALWPKARDLAPKIRVVVDALVRHFAPTPAWDRIDL